METRFSAGVRSSLRYEEYGKTLGGGLDSKPLEASQCDLKRMMFHLEAIKGCDIVRFSPNENNAPLEGAISAFMESKDCHANDLGVFLQMNDGHTVALQLHSEPNGVTSYRYYDPHPDAASREAVEEQVADMLSRFGIIQKSRFKVMSGHISNVSDVSGDGEKAGKVATALAMRDMLAGEIGLKVMPQEIQNWLARLDEEGASTSGQRSEMDDLLRKIHERSADGNKLATRLAKQSQAIHCMLNYLGTRKRTELQRLSRHFYNKVIPENVQQFSFADYPVTRTPLMGPTICREQLEEINELLQYEAPEITRFPAEAILAKLNLQKHKSFSGYLSGFSGKEVSNNLLGPMAAHEHLIAYYQKKYLNEISDPDTQEKKIALFQWMDDKTRPYRFTPGDGWVLTIKRDESNRIVSASIIKDEQISVVDMLNDVTPIPQALTAEIEARLDQAAQEKTLHPDYKCQVMNGHILNNLKPAWTHLLNGEVVLDVFNVPGEDAGVAQNDVLVKITPIKAASAVTPRLLYRARDIVIDAARGLHLSDKLKQSFQAHFRKLKMTHCLGKTLRPEIHPSTPKPDDNGYKFVLLRLAEEYANCRSTALNTAVSDEVRRHAKLNMPAYGRQIFHFFKDLLPHLHFKTCRDMAMEVNKRVSPAAFALMTAELRHAMEVLMAKQSGSGMDLKKYRDILNLFRLGIANAINKEGIKKADDTDVFPIIDKLGKTLSDIDRQLTLRENARKRLDERGVEHGHAGLALSDDVMQIDTRTRPDGNRQTGGQE